MMKEKMLNLQYRNVYTLTVSSPLLGIIFCFLPFYVLYEMVSYCCFCCFNYSWL